MGLMKEGGFLKKHLNREMFCRRSSATTNTPAQTMTSTIYSFHKQINTNQNN